MHGRPSPYRIPSNLDTTAEGSRAGRKLKMVSVEPKDDDADEYMDEEDEEEASEQEARTHDIGIYGQEDRSIQYELPAVAKISGTGNYVDGTGEGMIGMPNMGLTEIPTGSSIMMIKKRRLTNEQVRSLELSFERESRLEPERKNELAQELGLQPRQVAVWFQNRRARSKTKQLERDFDLLKLQYDAIRSEKEKLEAQVAQLKGLLDAHIAANKNVGDADSNGDEGIGKEIDLQRMHTQRTEALEELKNEKVRTHGNISLSTDVTLENVGSTFNNEVKSSTSTHMFEDLGKSLKNRFTLEVKPSVQVPHLEQYQQIDESKEEQHNSHANLCPQTSLSLCSPHQLLLHRMVGMKVESNIPSTSEMNPPQETHHQSRYKSPYVKNNNEEDPKSDYMIYFNTPWNSNP
ncbi:hypothetical protein KP509_08G017800 [Ceratopteris richardii]|nr:hypothetical protein KP509_08G017800 [Ceratopteris richardii]